MNKKTLWEQREEMMVGNNNQKRGSSGGGGGSGGVSEKKKLKDRVAKSFKTSEIGTIADIETLFGFLWKHGEREDGLTDRELRFRELWEELREMLMDRWNEQSRNIISLLDKYDVRQRRYHYQAKFIDPAGQ